MDIFDQGAVVEIEFSFFDEDNVPVDPDVVRFQYQSKVIGSITELVYLTNDELVQDAPGVYHVLIDTTPSGGLWEWRAFSTGAGQAAEIGEFYVRPNSSFSTTVPGVTIHTDTFTGSVDQLIITLASEPIIDGLLLFISGIYYTNYTLVDNVITLGIPLSGNEEIVAWYFALV